MIMTMMIVLPILITLDKTCAKPAEPEAGFFEDLLGLIEGNGINLPINRPFNNPINRPINNPINRPTESSQPQPGGGKIL